MSLGTNGANVIASFSLLKTLPLLMFFSFFYVALAFFWYSPSEGIESHVFNHGAYRTYALICGSFFSLVLLPYLVRAFRQLFFDRLRAVWIEDGWIFHLNRKIARRVDVETISVGPVDRYDNTGIILHLKDGSQKFIPTTVLSEPTEIIATRLREEL